MKSSLLIPFLLSFFLSFLFTPLSMWLARKVGAVAVPDERRKHKGHIPQLGGLAIFFSFVFTSLIYNRLGLIAWSSGYSAVLIGGALIVLLGMLDDIYELPPYIKFIGQAFAALIAISFGLKVTVISSPFSNRLVELGWIGTLATFLWIVGIVNAVNFIDGLDGLAAGICSISSVALLILALLLHRFEVALLFSTLAGASLGFLPYNFYPAKTFMGDTGAMFLGYAISLLAVMGAVKTALLVSIGVPFFVLAIPIIDAIFVTSKRIANRRSPFVGDRGHIHFTLLDMGYTEREVVLILYFATIIFSGLALFLARS
ncbi:undecaprenyl/decaprenyl-phosphate alpha-N-acetylglucosaminyl 1-phosphate transferase [bacterium]|nr:undecaprenyl/decaprenyl-phosphate alpha-N-acetylglucosaminyl 1-phosphate transferase [bacterium]